MSLFENLFRKFKRDVDHQEHKEHGESGSAPDNIPATDDEKTRKLESIRLYGVDFPIASNVEEFCKIAVDEGRCAMLIDISDYARMWQAAFRYFNDKFGVSSRLMDGVTSAQLLCLGCKLVFPFSYKFSLKGGFEGFRDVVGATEGYKEFGQTARCPKCSSGQAYFAIDNFPAEEITQRDIDYIGEYWHHLAQQWWKTKSRTQAFCDVCGSPVLRDDGYLRINDLLCKQCCETHLGSDSLEKLRKNPSYFGEWELRKARYFVTNLGVLHSSGTELIGKIREIAGIPLDYIESIQKSAKGNEDEEIALILYEYFWSIGDLKVLEESGENVETKRKLIFSKIREVCNLVFNYGGKNKLSKIYNRFSELTSPWINIEKKIQEQSRQIHTAEDLAQLTAMKVAGKAAIYIVNIQDIIQEILNK